MAPPPMPDTTARHEQIARNLYAAPRPARADLFPGTPGAGAQSSPQGRNRGTESKTPGKSSSNREGFAMSMFSAPQESHVGRAAVSGDELFVTFKEDGGGETAPYIYQFPTAAEAQAVYEEMRGSPHPYGQVLYPDVILGGIPFYQ